MNYNYVQAPLPFQGQKRRFLTSFKKELENFPSNAIYVDLFGGSGLLSHTVKQYYPDAQVIYNDFDNYSQRINNIDETNKLLHEIREIVKDQERDCKISEKYRDQILEKIKHEKGFVDYITLSSSLMFSMKYVTNYDQLQKETFYNKLRLSDYSGKGYLEGVEIVNSDYRKLFEKYSGYKNVVFLVDPPYLSTDTKTYNKTDYWKLSDYLNVLKVLEDQSYFYFTSDKSQIIELCNWIEQNGYCRNPFDGSRTTVIGVQMNHTAKYNDIMIVKDNF